MLSPYFVPPESEIGAKISFVGMVAGYGQEAKPHSVQTPSNFVLTVHLVTA
jgi:hypothetical protein